MSSLEYHPTLLSMPNEILTRIAYNTEPEALPLLRLTCKAACNVVNKPFGEHLDGFEGLVAQIHARRERPRVGREEDGEYNGPEWSDDENKDETEYSDYGYLSECDDLSGDGESEDDGPEWDIRKR